MLHRTLLGACAVALAALAGCYTGGDVSSFGPADPATPVATSASGTDPSSVVDTSASGLPCDVAEMLVRSCASCHGQPLAGGAPNRILTYADLTAPSLSDPTVTVAQMSISRMQSAQRPMPPTGAVAADLAILQAWVSAGSTKGACTSAAATPSSNTSYATPTVCSSGQNWTRGNRGSSSMRPGVACIACHDQGEGPSYSAAGTLYPTAHEPDDCYGASGTGATVEITDATGQTFTMTVNGAGNFYLRSRITPPYRAKVVAGGKTRAMATPQTNGDCNTCHTEQGDSATKTPGRVMAP